MDWFRVDASLADHPKTYNLEKALNDTNAIAYVIRLWSWTVRYASDGRLSDRYADVLERALRWSGAPGALLASLVETGWLLSLIHI